MATITLRSVKGSPLTNNEVDANFSNLNTDKVETSDAVSANTANKVVRRDADGNFSAGIITGAVTDIAGGTAGAVPFQSAANTTEFVAPGTDGYVLTSNGTDAPTWQKAAAGAMGGGTSNAVFFENDQAVTDNYTISTGKNAGTFGPITINNGVTVTIPDGSVWTIV